MSGLEGCCRPNCSRDSTIAPCQDWNVAADRTALKTAQWCHVKSGVLLQTEDQKVVDIKKQGVQPDSNTEVWACMSRLVNYKDGSELCNDAIAAQVAIIFGAGFDTSAHTITWALFELAADQPLQVNSWFEPSKGGSYNADTLH